MLKHFAIGSALLLISCSEENTLSYAEQERNFALNTQQLCISEAVFHPDFNVAVIQLREPPGEQFETALINRGWEKQEKIYRNEQLRCFQEYNQPEQQLIIKSDLYLPTPAEPKGCAPRR